MNQRYSWSSSHSVRVLQTHNESIKNWNGIRNVDKHLRVTFDNPNTFLSNTEPENLIFNGYGFGNSASTLFQKLDTPAAIGSEVSLRKKKQSDRIKESSDKVSKWISELPPELNSAQDLDNYFGELKIDKV